MTRYLLAAFCAICFAASSTAQAPEYSIDAVLYATSPGVPVSELVVGGPKDEKINLAMVVWLIRGGGRTILFDSGFHRDTFLKEFPEKDYLRPDEAVKLAGVAPDAVTDIVIRSCPLGPHGRHRPVSESDDLDPERRVSLLHNGRVATGRRSRRHRS